MASPVAATVADMLYALPPELRNMIYEETFFSDGRHIHDSFEPNMTRLALFAKSKLYHQEAASYLYEHGTFVIDGNGVACGESTILPPISNEYVTHMRRIDLRVRTGRHEFTEVQQAAHMISALGIVRAAAGRLFEEVNIRIELPIGMTPLLSCEFDDAVMGADHLIADALFGICKTPIAKKLHLHLSHGVCFAPGVACSLKQVVDRCSEAASVQVHMVEDNREVVVSSPEECERELSGKYNRLTNEEVAQCEDGSAPVEMILRTLNSVPIDIDLKEECLGIDDNINIDLYSEVIAATDGDAEWKAYEEMILFTPDLL